MYCLGVNLVFAQCQLVGRGKSHKKHDLSAWGNSAPWQGVVLPKSATFRLSIHGLITCGGPSGCT
jgi:hypothetical protein